jgi:hypothetical protein
VFKARVKAVKKLLDQITNSNNDFKKLEDLVEISLKILLVKFKVEITKGVIK